MNISDPNIEIKKRIEELKIEKFLNPSSKSNVVENENNKTQIEIEKIALKTKNLPVPIYDNLDIDWLFKEKEGGAEGTEKSEGTERSEGIAGIEGTERTEGTEGTEKSKIVEIPKMENPNSQIKSNSLGDNPTVENIMAYFKINPNKEFESFLGDMIKKIDDLDNELKCYRAINEDLSNQISELTTRMEFEKSQEELKAIQKKTDKMVEELKEIISKNHQIEKKRNELKPIIGSNYYYSNILNHKNDHLNANLSSNDDKLLQHPSNLIKINNGEKNLNLNPIESQKSIFNDLKNPIPENKSQAQLDLSIPQSIKKENKEDDEELARKLQMEEYSIPTNLNSSNNSSYDYRNYYLNKLRSSYNYYDDYDNRFISRKEKKEKGFTQDSINMLMKDCSFTSEEKNADIMCNICLQVYDSNRNFCKLKCNHIYHVECMTQWLYNNRNCPLCKNKIKI